jgi:hypothetical protein
LPWRTRFRLHGSPGTAAGLRSALLGQGLVESDWRPTHIVVALPVEVMMAEHWAARARAGGILKWSALWRRAVAGDRLPAPIDVTAIAHRLADRLPGSVHVVVARDPAHAAALACDVLGARDPAVPAGDDAARTDLLRRLNRLLPLTRGPSSGLRLDATVLARVLPDAAPTRPPGPPPPARAWASGAAAALVGELREAGYAVHGTPDELAPPDAWPTGTIDRERTLELALAACRRAWHLQGGS